eukprot:GILI01015063.1.p1 GENE.GILI01015063.1~~GILI01015063.1.p1  ORF type:complete len:603 (-),score=152.24 GILI01015063.1:244-2052(-)
MPSLSSQTGLSMSNVASPTTNLATKPPVSYDSIMPTAKVIIGNNGSFGPLATLKEEVAHRPVKNLSIIIAREGDVIVDTEADKGNTAVKQAETAAASGNLKWGVLILTCMLLFGSDYCYDLPGAFGAGEGVTIQTYFASKGATYNQKMNQALYAIYSYPNMVMTIVGGLLIDKYLGLRKTTMLFCGIVVLASFVFAVGVATTSYSTMVLARFMFGCSAENLFVAQGSFVSRWFGGSKFMAFAFGIAVSFSRLGGALVYLLSPVVANDYGAPASAFAGFGIALLSFVSALALVWVDYRSEKNGTVRPAGGSSHGPAAATPSKDLELGDVSSPASPTSAEELQHPFLLSYFSTLPKTLWFLAAGCALCYGATFPFVAIAKTYFERIYGMDAGTASYDTGLFHLLGALLCPLVGLAVDRVGKSPIWLGISSSGLAAVFTILLMFPGALNAIFVMMALSLMYATFIAGLWSFVNYTTPSAAGGFALGIMIAATNFGLATNPLVVGTILDAHTGTAVGVEGSPVPLSTSDDELLPSAQGFHYVLIFLIFTSLLALLNAFVLWRVDKANKGILMADPAKRVALKAEMDEQLIAEWRRIDAEALEGERR